jgi:ABC-2 type transport system permease protein
MRTRQYKDWIQIILKVPLAEFKRYFLLEWRYPVEGIGKLVMLFLLFRAITWGGNMIAPTLGGEAFTRGQTERLVGYTFFFLVAVVMQNGANLIKQESELGTFEQVYLSPVGLAYIILCRSISGVAANLVPMTILFSFTAWTLSLSITEVSVSIPFILILGSMGMQGIGFFLSGVALIFKRIQVIVNLLTLLLLAISVLPSSQMTGNLEVLTSWFPFTQAIKLLANSLLGQPLVSRQLVILSLSSAALFIAGYLFLTWLEKIALDKGLIGQY